MSKIVPFREWLKAVCEIRLIALCIRIVSPIAAQLTKPRITRKVVGVPIASDEFEDLWFGGLTTRRFFGLGRAIDHPIIYRGVLDALGRFIDPSQAVLFRVDSACFTGGLFHDQNCDCPWQLRMAMQALSELPEGLPGLIIHHLHHEGRGRGWVMKLRSYEPYENEPGGHFPVKEKRRFRTTIAILHNLGVQRVVTMTNSPQKLAALSGGGIEVVDSVGLVSQNPRLQRYLLHKEEKYGHKIGVLDQAND